MEGSGSAGPYSDEGFPGGFASDFLPCSGAGSSFQAALQSVAAEHGREVQRMQMKMAELRELVTHLQWRTLGQEVRSTSVEVSDAHGAPLVVETVMADGRTFTTLEPPELDVRRATKERPGHLARGRSLKYDPSDGTVDVDGKPKTQGQNTLQTHNSEGLQRRTVDNRTSNRLAKELLEYETTGQRLWRERQSLQRSLMSLHGSLQSNNLRQCSPRLQQLVNHWSFDFLCGMVIVINTVLIGLSTQHVAVRGGQDKLEYEIAGMICNAFFLVELMLRLQVMGLRFFTTEGWRWNLFDMFLVLFSILDAVIQYGYNADAGAVGQSMKTVKMLRIVRVFRVFRFFTELRILALMILDSFRSLAWALLMLIIIMYVFAIWFTQDVASHILKVRSEGLPVDPVLTEYFGNLLLTLSSLFHAMLNGISWIELTNGLKYEPSMQALFFFYVSFTLLATAHTQREFLVEKQIEQKQKWLQEMKELFQEMDKEGCGSISLETIQEFLKDARVESYFQALGLEPHDTERLFDHLDDDNSGEVSLDEFLQGCLRLRGQARSIDVYSVMHDVRSLNSRFEELVDSLRGVARLASESSSRARKSSYAQSQACVDMPGAVFSKQGAVKTLSEPVEDDEMPTVIQRSTKPALMADGTGGQR
ncbi:unnamed protein product [Prorocentrum cordatum]|uniref:EF-hand domain-containing protein n=1 Tax=Prorocentrum cordatum TaxID=2364126 RepID=A0ABN9Y8K3_9DINO|nr:unnamed protein product [Polarella glacialis]